MKPYVEKYVQANGGPFTIFKTLVWCSAGDINRRTIMNLDTSKDLFEFNHDMKLWTKESNDIVEIITGSLNAGWAKERQHK